MFRPLYLRGQNCWAAEPVWACWRRETSFAHIGNRTPDRPARTLVTTMTELSRIRIQSFAKTWVGYLAYVTPCALCNLTRGCDDVQVIDPCDVYWCVSRVIKSPKCSPPPVSCTSVTSTLNDERNARCWHRCRTELTLLRVLCVGRDSSVGMATRYGLDGPGIESRWRRDFPHPSRPALGPTKPYNENRDSIPRVKRPGRGFNHPQPYTAEVKERAELHLSSPSRPSWPVLLWPLPLRVLSILHAVEDFKSSGMLTPWRLVKRNIAVITWSLAQQCFPLWSIWALLCCYKAPLITVSNSFNCNVRISCWQMAGSLARTDGVVTKRWKKAEPLPGELICRRVRKIAKSEYEFRHVCPSVGFLSAWNSAPTGRILIKLDI